MANLAASAVTVERAWTEGGVTGKDVRCLEVTLVLTGQGAATNKILATTLRLKKIEQVGSCRRDDDDILLAGPSYDGSMLLLYNLKQVTDANREDPADVTDTIRVVVKGPPSGDPPV